MMKSPEITQMFCSQESVVESALGHRVSARIEKYLSLLKMFRRFVAESASRVNEPQRPFEQMSNCGHEPFAYLDYAIFLLDNNFGENETIHSLHIEAESAHLVIESIKGYRTSEGCCKVMYNPRVFDDHLCMLCVLSGLTSLYQSRFI